jgi:hypothetical protein
VSATPALFQLPPRLTLADGAERSLGDFLCASCGYGIAVSRLPEQCPMCAASEWVEKGRAGRDG